MPTASGASCILPIEPCGIGRASFAQLHSGAAAVLGDELDAGALEGGANDACCEAIFDMEPSTYRELAFQAAVLDLHWEHRWVARVHERLLALADVTPYWG